MNKPKDQSQTEREADRASEGINDILSNAQRGVAESLTKSSKSLGGTGKLEAPSNSDVFNGIEASSDYRTAFFTALNSRDFRKIKRTGDAYRKYLSSEHAFVERELQQLGLLTDSSLSTPQKNDDALSSFLQARKLGEGKDVEVKEPRYAPLLWENLSSIEEMHKYNSSVDESRKVYPKITPYDFILRVYQPWVGVCLLREDITGLDKKLGEKYSKFLWRRNTRSQKSPVLPPLLPKRSQLAVAQKRGVEMGGFERRWRERF